MRFNVLATSLDLFIVIHKISKISFVKTTILPLSIRTSVAKSCAIHPNLVDCVKAVQNNYFTPAFMLLYIELD